MIMATVGLTTDTTAVSGCYSPTNTLAYSAKAYSFEGLRDAGAYHETNEECFHVLPEVWNGQTTSSAWMSALALSEGYIEPVQGNGQVGNMSWYVAAFTIDNDATLASFYGLQGEANRRKLAEAFLKPTPTTWKEYCEEVSPNNCTAPDETARRYPQEGDETKFFASSAGYFGHFRKTRENDCTAFPDTCVGHFIAPPCS
jgi:hypothetical protein